MFSYVSLVCKSRILGHSIRYVHRPMVWNIITELLHFWTHTSCIFYYCAYFQTKFMHSCHCKPDFMNQIPNRRSRHKTWSDNRFLFLLARIRCNLLYMCDLSYTQSPCRSRTKCNQLHMLQRLHYIIRLQVAPKYNRLQFASVIGVLQQEILPLSNRL